MTEPTFQPSEEQLHAYVDDFLPEAERMAVERYLADHPSEALRIEAYRQQNAALQGLRALPEAHPFTLPEFRPRVRWRAVALRTAAAAVLLLAGGGGGWWLHGHLERGRPLWMRLVEQAERAHQTFVPEVVHPVEVTSAHEQHLRTWLSRRLGTPVTVPVLKRHGYDLMGGRLLPASPGPAAQFMYQDAQGNRLTLYMLAAPTGRRDTSFRYVQDGALRICYWMGQTMDFAITGEMPRDQLDGIAKSVYLQLNHMKPPRVGAW
ncbi:MAG TPA: anti-sigma factor [bacterium]|nr:anti-sigma factor [bacterium]